MYIFYPLTNTFPLDGARPIIIPQEYIQATEVALLENIDRIKFIHKLYNLIQSTKHEFSPSPEELDKIRALELLPLLLCVKKVIRILAKLLLTSDTIKINFRVDFSLNLTPRKYRFYYYH